MALRRKRSCREEGCSVVTWCGCSDLELTLVWRVIWGKPQWLSGKELPAMQESQEMYVQLLGSGRSPGEGNGKPLQYSCLEYPMDGGAWWATVHGVPKSQTRLSDFTFTKIIKGVHWFLQLFFLIRILPFSTYRFLQLLFKLLIDFSFISDLPYFMTFFLFVGILLF